MAGIRIIGYGRARGEQVVTNDDMTEIVDTSDEWIRTKTGIRSRYFAKNLKNSDMAQAAAEQALKEAGIDRTQVGLLLVCTFSPDRESPTVSCDIAGKLGLDEEVMAVDLNGGCTGFIYGCNLANAMLSIKEGKKYAVVVGSERISPLINMTDRSTCVLFGDGAGAVVLEHDEDKNFTAITGCVSDDDVLWCDSRNGGISMKGQEVYRFAVSKVCYAIEKILSKSGCSHEEIDYYVCHQANERIIDSAALRLKTDKEKFFKNLYNYGNTSAASIPIALCEMHEQGLLRDGMKLICTGFGAGLTYGSILLEI